MGCDWIGNCEKKVHTSSQWLQIQSCLIPKHKALCVVTKKTKLLIVKMYFNFNKINVVYINENVVTVHNRYSNIPLPNSMHLLFKLSPCCKCNLFLFG